MDRGHSDPPRPLDYAGSLDSPLRGPYPRRLTGAALSAAALFLPVLPVTAVYTLGGGNASHTEFQSYGAACAMESGLVSVSDVHFERSAGFWIGGPVVLMLALVVNGRIARWYDAV